MGTPLYVFEQHIETIKQLGFEIVQQITDDKKQIMLCFDDGFHGIWDNKEFVIDNNRDIFQLMKLKHYLHMVFVSKHMVGLIQIWQNSMTVI